jgi:hypothetical protein
MAFGFSLSNKKVSQNYAKIAALKLGESMESNKKNSGKKRLKDFKSI